MKKRTFIEVKPGPGMQEIGDLPILLKRCHKPGDETAGVGTAGIPEREPAIGFLEDRIP